MPTINITAWTELLDCSSLLCCFLAAQAQERRFAPYYRAYRPKLKRPLPCQRRDQTMWRSRLATAMTRQSRSGCRRVGAAAKNQRGHNRYLASTPRGYRQSAGHDRASAPSVPPSMPCCNASSRRGTDSLPLVTSRHQKGNQEQ